MKQVGDKSVAELFGLLMQRAIGGGGCVDTATFIKQEAWKTVSTRMFDTHP